MQRLTLPIVVESDEDGYFVACPSLQGCHSQGETYEEAIANIKDAIRLHVEDRQARWRGSCLPGVGEPLNRGSRDLMPKLPRLTAREIRAVLEK
jgi:predicted RNase H-like HicB family nuclease